MRHRAYALLATLPTVFALVSLTSLNPAAADNGMSTDASLSNHFYGWKSAGGYDGTSYGSEKTAAFVDPARHLIFESNRLAPCPAVYVLDADTYRLIAQGNEKSSLGGCDPEMTPPGTSLAPPVAVDSKAGLLLVADNQGSGQASQPLVSAGVPVPVLRVSSETTLKTLAQWSIPTSSSSGAQNTPDQGATTGVSYYAPLDEALLVVGNGSDQPGEPIVPGLTVVSYAVNAGLKQGSPVVLWSVNISQCQAPLEPQFVSAAPYHAASEAALYVPCVLSGAPPTVGPPGTFERDGVVKVPMTTSGCTPPATECPDATHASVAVAPGITEDALFDPGSDRMLLPSTSSGVVEVLVYDGHLNQFLGASVVGGRDDSGSLGGTSMGLDPTTGRLYVRNTGGLLLLDARRTPVTPGAVFPEFAEREYSHGLIPVLPPDAAHPYTRVFINHDVGYQAGNATSGRMPVFSVFADRVPVTSDPPAAKVDENTLNGPAPDGAVLQQTYGGTARGYGFHSDLVGGPADLGNGGSLVNGALYTEGLPPVKIPLGQGNRDLLGGSVEKLSLQNGSVDGRASALGIADDSTAFALQQCTDAQQLVNCVAPPTCDQLLASTGLGPCPQTPAPPSAPQPTGQAPPFLEAQCSQPGSADDLKSQWDGAYYTTWSQDSSGNWQPSEQPVPATDQNVAHGKVDCSPTATGEAWLRATQVPAASGVTVNIAEALSTATVAPPTDKRGSTSDVSAWAHGITIDLGNGQKLTIGEVSQVAHTEAAGTAGSAKASDTVVVSGVSLNGTPVCQSQCDPTQLAAALNTAFPTQMFVDFPALEGHYDTRFLHCQGVQVQASVTSTCAGSPGGYIAAIQANSTEQYGDQQFNGMSADVASFLPAMRVILYFTNDGSPARTREVLDLAGVEADSERGFSALFEAPPPPSISELPTAIIESLGHAATTQYIPGTDATLTGGGGGGPFSNAGGVLGVVTKTFAGLQWLVRSPWAALQMIGFLGVLALPIVLARRRGADAA